MANTCEPDNPPTTEPATTADRRLTALSCLLADLDDIQTPASAKVAVEHQNRLVQVRLGIASSLFHALRAKHAPTAAHSLRVALGCSSWTLSLDVTEQERDEIEVAALLHDIGKIGVADSILLKAGKLTPEESKLVDRHRQTGSEVLNPCCDSPNIPEMIYYVDAYYNGAKPGFDRQGEELPLGSRMIAIVDAFDAMTTDRVYRRAMSRERAVAELFECAGTQFDPQLVKSFGMLLSGDQGRLNRATAARWLQQLNPQASNAFWRLNEIAAPPPETTVEDLYYQKLLDSMHDAVVFVDLGLKIVRWNRAAERLTGVKTASIQQQRWSPELIDLSDENGIPIPPSECPLSHAIAAGIQTVRRLSVRGRSGNRLRVDAHLIPVVAGDGACHGVTLLLHDVSSEATLERRVQSLHQKATRDPLTQVANRAEFDRALRHFVETHLELALPCSLIICDLDHFKRINDTYGHQAGDEALVSFAALLKRFCREGDLVARYGGEEFVMLCADCDNATSTIRADEIRRELASTPQSMLGGHCISASFGVTELQAGDTPETMLRRADRALLKAKDSGRNRVVQLGTGMSEASPTVKKISWFSWFRPAATDELVDARLVTAVPLNVAAEKLKGFVADHHAEITTVDENQISLKIDAQHTPLTRRASDRPVPFFVTLVFQEKRSDPNVHSETKTQPEGTQTRTLIHVTIRPKRQRDRRRSDVVQRARHLLHSLKSYMMATETTSDVQEADRIKRVFGRAKSLFGRSEGSS